MARIWFPLASYSNCTTPLDGCIPRPLRIDGIDVSASGYFPFGVLPTDAVGFVVGIIMSLLCHNLEVKWSMTLQLTVVSLTANSFCPPSSRPESMAAAAKPICYPGLSSYEDAPKALPACKVVVISASVDPAIVPGRPAECCRTTLQSQSGCRLATLSTSKTSYLCADPMWVANAHWPIRVLARCFTPAKRLRRISVNLVD